MKPTVSFAVLGTVEVVSNGHPVPVSRPLRRALLALLLLNANRALTVDEIIRRLWGDRPPATARAQVHALVSALRCALPSGDRLLHTHPSGYSLEVVPDQLDLPRFQHALDGARRTAELGDLSQAAARYRAALGLWRGPALSDITACFVHRARHRLDEQRLTAVEELMELTLELGHHAGLVAELTELVETNPLRERLRRQLMLALYRGGRRPDALRVYRDGRAAVVDGHGLDPSPELEKFAQRILRSDPTLLMSQSAEPASEAASRPSTTMAQDRSPTPATRHGAPQWTKPCLLPPDIGDFTGRLAEINEIRSRLTSGAVSPEVPVIAMTGRGGIGKTTLTVHIAHLLRGEYADGQLYADLGGARAHPADPAEVLGQFLISLGVPQTLIPRAVEDRAARYRGLLADRRVLIVLDDVANEEHTRHLLPGTTSCAVLISSRRRLTALPAAQHIDVDMLSPEESRRLLGLIAGRSRVEAEPEAVGRLALMCGGLPLALRVAGARLAAKPHWTVQKLAARVADEGRRLDELSHGDIEVRASIALGYHGLTSEARTMFRRLSLLEVPDFGAWIGAAACEITPDRAETLIEELVDARLLDVVCGDIAGHTRYRWHDLIRVYARERASEKDPPQDRHATLSRCLGAWLTLAYVAEDRLPHGYFGTIRDSRLAWQPDATLVSDLLARPMDWLESERHALRAVVTLAATAGEAHIACQLAGSLVAFYELRGYHDDWHRTHTTALEAARDAHDELGEAIVLRGLAELHNDEDRYPPAVEYFQRARSLFAAHDLQHGSAVCDAGLGLLYRLMGRHSEALVHFGRAAEVSARLGQRRTQAYAVHGQGVVQVEEGDFGAAEAAFNQAVELATATNYRRGVVQSLRGLGRLHTERGVFHLAIDTLTRALGISRDLGDKITEAHVAQLLGDAYVRAGNPGEAGELLERALGVLAEHGERFGEALTLRTLGELRNAECRPVEARDYVTRSLAITAEIDAPLWHARSLRTMANVFDALGEPEPAKAARAQADEILNKRIQRRTRTSSTVSAAVG